MANSPMRAMVDVGSVIADTYTIEALIGMGGMGAVFLATHKRLAGKRVAIKVLHAIDDPEVLARFKREADIAAKLDHPNIVGVIDYNVMPDGTPYLVLDYLQGETLAQRIKGGPMPVEQITSITRQVGSALAAAHRAGIVHRDLKPQNIFLVPTEVDGRHVELAKVLDFGISKIRGSQTVKTQESALLGTPQYMAPEQATGQHASVDERTDVWALGAIVYEMVCGHPAFAGASIPEVVFKVVYEQPTPLVQEAPSVPAAIAAAVDRAMSKQADQRFANIDQLVEALTGQPLTLTRGRATPASAEARHVSNSDALAQTMGSGDHQDPALSVPVQPLRTVSPNAVTVASQSEPATPVRARRPVAAIAAIAITCAAAAAAAVYFIMREHEAAPAAPVAAHEEHKAHEPAKLADHHRPPEPPHHVAETSPPRPPPAPVSKAPSDTPRPGGEGRHATDTAKPPTGDPKPADTPDDTVPDEQAATKLSEAQSALDAGKYDLAERLANAVINAQNASPRQHTTARVIHGSVQCLARNDEEAARIDLRNIKGPARKKLLEICRQHGLLTD